MLLFQKRFHPGLVSGAVTVTFRAWEKPHVKAGGRYRVHPIGVVEVESVTQVKWKDISEKDARASGFESLEALRAYVTPVVKTGITEQTLLFKVVLHHGGDGDRVALALEDQLSAADVAAICTRLARFDAGPEGPWVRETFALIRKKPRVAASKLAKSAGRETEPFKSNVRKLKRLGLTQSFEVGYEVSPRGVAFLKKRPKW